MIKHNIDLIAVNIAGLIFHTTNNELSDNDLDKLCFELRYQLRIFKEA